MLILALATFAFGPGKFSLDYLLRRFVFSRDRKSRSDDFDVLPHAGHPLPYTGL